jgi:type VI secretion system secreted protein Hcp
MFEDIFVVVKGISGESQDAIYPDSIEAVSWQWKITQQSTMHSGSGGGPPRASVHDLLFTHRIDRASPNLATYCFQGKHIPEAVLIQRKAGGVPHDYLRICMYDVVITQVEPFSTGMMAMEHVALSFARMKQEYRLQNRLGGNQGGVTGLIDVKANRAA